MSTHRRRGFVACAIVAFGLLPLNFAAANGPKKGQSPTRSDAPVSWNGIYGGAGLGVSFGEVDWRYRSGFAPEENPLDLDRALAASLHLGIQRQFGMLVAGLETSFLFGNLGGDSRCVPPASPFTCSVDVNWIWMVGPRLGIATNKLHLYTTGGYAFGDLDTKSVTTATGALFETGGGMHNGWYFGGGVELSLTKSAVLGVEYRRIQLDNAWHYSSAASDLADRSVDATVDTIQARLTFKLGEVFDGMRSR